MATWAEVLDRWLDTEYEIEEPPWLDPGDIEWWVPGDEELTDGDDEEQGDSVWCDPVSSDRSVSQATS